MNSCNRPTDSPIEFEESFREPEFDDEGNLLNEGDFNESSKELEMFDSPLHTEFDNDAFGS